MPVLRANSEATVSVKKMNLLRSQRLDPFGVDRTLHQVTQGKQVAE
jgi:hypothetical protein